MTEATIEYRETNAAKHFLEAIQEEQHKIKVVLANTNAMVGDPQDWHIHKTSTICHVCKKPLDGNST